MSKPVAITLAAVALVLAAGVAYFTFRPTPPPSMPASPGAVPTPDGAEVTHP